MNQEKFGKIIKKIRKEHHLTQKDLADKYNVTYQAVSKWENGLNMPDISLIKEIAKDFNLSLDDLLNSKYKKPSKNIIYILLTAIFIVSALIITIIISNRNEFAFKTITTNCDKFTISGSLAYDKNKTAIHISNINYCGGTDTKIYKKIECTLDEKNKDITKTISNCTYANKEDITLEEYLKNVSITVDNYNRTCPEYKNNDLYLEINATNKNNEITTYIIPLTLEDKCHNN